MRIIVSDTSCMIDLRKADLLEALLKLPYTFVMPNTLFEDEWLCLTDGQRKMLRSGGLEVRELPGPSVTRAAGYFNKNRRLKLNDCFALALVEDIGSSILLTGDGLLRRVAEDKGIEVRGVLWVIDEFEAHGVLSHRRLYDALKLFQEDVLVFLPADELLHRIRRLAKLL
jgi:predicted nucleic acid-binding protein